MSSSLKLLFNIILFSVLVVAAGKKKSGESDVISAEIGKIEKLAKRTDLTVKEWIDFANDLEQRCAKATDDNTKQDLCMLFFDIVDVVDVFRQNPNGPTTEQCLQHLRSNESLSSRPSLYPTLTILVKQLCRIK